MQRSESEKQVLIIVWPKRTKKTERKKRKERERKEEKKEEREGGRERERRKEMEEREKKEGREEGRKKKEDHMGENKIQGLRKMYFDIRDHSYYANQMQMRSWPTTCFFGWSP